MPGTDGDHAHSTFYETAQLPRGFHNAGRDAFAGTCLGDVGHERSEHVEGTETMNGSHRSRGLGPLLSGTATILFGIFSPNHAQAVALAAKVEACPHARQKPLATMAALEHRIRLGMTEGEMWHIVARYRFLPSIGGGVGALPDGGSQEIDIFPCVDGKLTVGFSYLAYGQKAETATVKVIAAPHFIVGDAEYLP